MFSNKKYILDSNLFYIFLGTQKLINQNPTVNPYSLTNQYQPTNMQNCVKVMKYLGDKQLYTSEWVISEIIANQGNSIDFKFNFLKYISDNDIKVIPCNFKNNISAQLAALYSQYNFERIPVEENKYAYKLKNNNTNPVVLPLVDCSSYIINEKMNCEADFFRVFLLLFQQFIIDSLCRQNKRKINKVKIKAFRYYTQNHFESQIALIRTQILNYLTNYYTSTQKAKTKHKLINKQLTELTFTYIDEVIEIYNKICAGNISSIDSNYLGIKYFAKNNNKLINQDPTINRSKIRPTSQCIQNGTPPVVLSSYLGIQNFSMLKFLSLIYFCYLTKSCLPGIIKYYTSFMDAYFNYSGVIKKQDGSTEVTMIDKNNIFDSLILSHYRKYIILTDDKCFNAIINMFDKKYGKYNKTIILV